MKFFFFAASDRERERGVSTREVWVGLPCLFQQTLGWASALSLTSMGWDARRRRRERERGSFVDDEIKKFNLVFWFLFELVQ